MLLKNYLTSNRKDIYETAMFSYKLSLLFCVAILNLLFTEIIYAQKVLPEPFGRVYWIYYHGNIRGKVNNAFYFKTIDIGLKGALLDYLKYKVQINLDSKTLKFQPLDTYCGIKISSFIELLIGQFKPPFSMERLIPSPEQDFVMTAIATKLLPERDIGITLCGETNRIEFNAGILNGAGFNNPENNSKKDLVERFLFKPIKATRIGGAIYWGWEGPDTNILAKRRYNFQAEIKYPEFHIRSEYTWGKDDNIERQACYAQTGYKIALSHNRYLKKLEPLIRYEWYNSNSEIQTEKFTIITLGINLYFYEHKFKCQVNYNLRIDKITNQNSNEFYTGLQISF